MCNVYVLSHRKQFQVYFAGGQDELITLEDTKVIPKMCKLFRITIIITLYHNEMTKGAIQNRVES